MFFKNIQTDALKFSNPPPPRFDGCHPPNAAGNHDSPSRAPGSRPGAVRQKPRTQTVYKTHMAPNFINKQIEDHVLLVSTRR